MKRMNSLPILAVVPLFMAISVPTAASAASPAYETRAAFVASLDQALGVSPVYPQTPSFSDVPASNPAYGYIEAAVLKGWISGLPNGTFDPNGPLTREAIAKIEVLAVGQSALATSLKSTVPAFRDAKQIPQWAYGYINAATKLGLLRGEADGAFSPNTDLTVAQESDALAQVKTYLSDTTGASVTSLSMAAPVQVTAGVPFDVTLTANGDPTYAGTDPVVMTTGIADASAKLPTQAVYKDGKATISVTLTNAKEQVVTLVDATLAKTATAIVQVAPNKPFALSVSTASTFDTAGTPIFVTVTVQDRYKNTIDFSGTVPASVLVFGDSGAKTPTSISFSHGTAMISVTPSVTQTAVVSVAVGIDNIPLTGQSNGVSVSGNMASITIANTDLSSGGPISAYLSPAPISSVSWRLVGSDGFTYPLFGSTMSTLNQALPEDIQPGSYMLEATNTSTDATYKILVSMSSSFPTYTNTVSPFDVYNAQDMIPVYNLGLYGQNETIALYEQSGYTASDIAQFDQTFGLPSANISVVPLVGSALPVDTAINGPGFEATMDIEWAHAMAPFANIVVYEAPSSTNFLTMANAVVSNAASKNYNAVSFSYSTTQDGYISPSNDSIIQNAVQSGLAVFAGSGDNGLEAAGSNDWPSANPYVVSVGGVQYDSTGIDYWNAGVDATTNQLAAGGYGTTDYPAPIWQTTDGLGSHRVMPDVSFLASNAFIVFNGQVYLGNGTSLAAPCWAGIWTLADQAYRANYPGVGGIKGPAPKIIYEVANNTSVSAFPSSAGNPSAYNAQVGLGAPDVAKFVIGVLNLKMTP